MSFLTLNGLKKALQYVQENSKKIKYHPFEPLKGMIVIPKNVPDDDQYHLFLIQKFEPRLIDKFSNELTLLSINGQEFLDILSDDKYIETLRNQIRKLGYSEPSDRQIYKLLKQQMGDYSAPVVSPVNDVINAIASLADKRKNEIDVTPKWALEQKPDALLASQPEPELPQSIVAETVEVLQEQENQEPGYNRNTEEKEGVSHARHETDVIPNQSRPIRGGN